ncbi:penicillin-binding protein 1B [Thiovibrio sp. JS02]
MVRKRNKVGKGAAGKKSMGGNAPLVKWVVLAFFLLVVSFVLYVGYLDRVIREKFEGKRWSLPAVVYARPLELYPGLAISLPELEEELQLAGYRRDRKVSDPGGYDRQEGVVHLVTRDFHFPDGPEKSAKYTLSFAEGTLVGIFRADSGEALDGVRLDPARIGSFHPKQHEDRIVLSREELPDLLVKTLLAVEDQNFYSHSGLDPLAILRALLANTMAGETVQGGSTLTQQLVKNFFLSNERTLWRKFNEAIMALLLEAHYDKDEILTAYTNEIFLGQDGGRAVHGFGLASLFYFRRELADLSPAQIATLVGMVRGPSYYDPRKDPERCLKRRQVVLEVMRSQKVIDERTHKVARAAALGSQALTGNGFNRFPAFLDLVRRQLAEEYREEDLTSDGMKIFTTLDPRVQKIVEKQLEATIARLEKSTGKRGLDGAVVVTRREGGEILAVAGGRTPLQSGFNRALDARRHVGSLIKPAVYLAALGKGYTLATPVEDTAFTVPNVGGKPWSPVNYDRTEHGRVPMYLGLAYSLNLATVKIGMDVGVKKVVQTVKDLGVHGDFPAYPSFLLGAVSLTPLEVAQMYQTLASGGFYLPQRAISSVLAADNTVVKRFGISVEERFAPEQVYLLNIALQHVVSDGTGKVLSQYLSPSYNVAGKTGTSDDLRDSWFAGFTGDQLAVVWLGKDDNKPIGLTGSGGALVVWGEIMRALHPQPLDLVEPEGIEWQWLKSDTLELSASPFFFAADQVKLPFVAGTVPGPSGSSASGSQDSPTNGVGDVVDKILDWFN